MQITRKGNRIFEIETQRKVMRTPFFFPAISSIKTNFPVKFYIDLVKTIGYPAFLVSSYDINRAPEDERKELTGIVSESTEKGIITLLDSGGYEAYWYHDKKWNFEDLESILSEIIVDFCFSYDVYWEEGKNEEKHISETITSIAKTAAVQKVGTTIPSLHSPSVSFHELVPKIVKGIYPQIVGVPERELGPGIFERAETVKKIRDELDKIDKQIPLHILGTGHPLSLLTYTVCGADLYDGLEWCNTTVDHETGQLYHFVQRELFDCSCSACKNKGASYPIKTIGHNLIFYRQFTDKIRNSLEKGEIDHILDVCLSEKSSARIKKIAGLK